ncbi:MAG: dTMP kinase [Nitriliruptoraceae bacterium]
MGGPEAVRARPSVALPATSASALRALAGSPPFRRMAAATGSSALGDWIGFLAIIALTADILGPTRAAAFAVSGVMTARVLPSLLLAPVAGVFVDRWNRKRVLIVTDLGRASVMALIPFTDEILTLVLATLLIEVLSALFAPAKDAVFPTLVRRDQLVTANQINLVLTYGALPLAGVLYAVLVVVGQRVAPDGSLLAARPVALPIWFNALSFVVSAAFIAAIPVRRHAGATREAGEAVGAAFREGIAFVAGRPVIRALIGGVMVAAAAAGVVISTGEFFAALLNAGPSGFGVLVAAVGVGMVGGLLLAGPLSRRVRPEWLFPPALGGAGVGLAAAAVMPGIVAAVPAAVVMGAGAGVVFIVGYTVLQQRAEDRIRGRVFGAFNAGVRIAIFGATIAVPFTIGLVGREARVIDAESGRLIYPYVFGGVRLTLLATAALTVVGALVATRVLRTALRGERLAAAADPSVPVPAAPRPRGMMVAFEGGDGSGKSTQIALLRDHLEALGLRVVVTREPGGTAIGERIRELLLDPGSAAMTDRAEALLYAAARAQHVEEVIAPALADGAVVLCDRFIDSSVAYQGAGRGLGEPRVEALNLWATAGVLADLVVLLDLDAGEGLRRAVADTGPDRLEAAGDRFHADVRAAYRRRAAAEPHRWLLLDAAQPVADLHARIRADVTVVLGPLLEAVAADATAPATALAAAPAAAPAVAPGAS